MGDMGDDYRDYREAQREAKAQNGVPCPVCTVKRPKAQAKILMQGQRCWCGYIDPRPRNGEAGKS